MDGPPGVACMDTRHPRRLLAPEQVLMRFSIIYVRPSPNYWPRCFPHRIWRSLYSVSRSYGAGDRQVLDMVARLVGVFGRALTQENGPRRRRGNKPRAVPSLDRAFAPDLAIKCATHSGSTVGRKIRSPAYPRPMPMGFHAFHKPDSPPSQIRLCVAGFMTRFGARGPRPERIVRAPRRYKATSP